jgi:hypothetical protein
VKARYVIVLLIFTLAGACAVIGAVLQSQCTQFNQLIGNCADTSPWFVAAGIGVCVALVSFAIALLTDEAHTPKL